MEPTQTYQLWLTFIERADRTSLRGRDRVLLNKVIIAWHDLAQPIDYDRMMSDLTAFDQRLRLAIVETIYHGVELLEQHDARS